MNPLVTALLTLILSGQPFQATAELTWYDPSLGGINCFEAECERLGTGHLVNDWYQRAVACPLVFPRRTQFTVSGSWRGLADGEYLCLDAGSMVVVQPDGTFILDVLSRYPIWREQLQVTVTVPVEDAPRVSAADPNAGSSEP